MSVSVLTPDTVESPFSLSHFHWRSVVRWSQSLVLFKTSGLSLSGKAAVKLSSILLWLRVAYDVASATIPGALFMYCILLPIAGPLAHIRWRLFMFLTSTHKPAAVQPLSPFLCLRVFLSAAAFTLVAKVCDSDFLRLGSWGSGIISPLVGIFVSICITHAFVHWLYAPYRGQTRFSHSRLNPVVLRDISLRAASIALWFVATQVVHRRDETPLFYLFDLHNPMCLRLLPLVGLILWKLLSRAQRSYMSHVCVILVQTVKFAVLDTIMMIASKYLSYATCIIGGSGQRVTYDSTIDPPKPLHSGLYQRLGPQAIRLLLIHPRQAHGQVRCTLFETPLSATPYFEAVSYVWGDDTRNHMVHVNDRMLLVPTNAFHVLHDISSTLVPRVVWIDTICINQDDMEERSQQVQLMGDIYSSARLITIWMRSQPVNTNQTKAGHFSDIRLALRVVQLLNTLASFSDNGHGGQSVNLLHIWQATRPSVRRSLTSLLENPWFERMWVVQEVTLASSVRVLVDCVEIGWDNFVKGLSVLGTNYFLAGLSSQTVIRAAESVQKIQQWRIELNQKNETHLWDLLDGTVDRQAGNPKDKVYALLGIHKPFSGKQFSLVVDYRKTVSQVYTDAARQMLAMYTVPGLLAKSGTGYSAHRSKDVQDAPSWVPDFNQSRRYQSLGRRIQPRQFVYDTWLQDTEVVDSSGAILTVSARQFDTVRYLAPVYLDLQRQPRRRQSETDSLEDSNDDGALADFDDALRTTLHTVEQHFGQDCPNYSPIKPPRHPQSVEEALCRTIVGNHVPDPWSRRWWDGMLLRRGIRQVIKIDDDCDDDNNTKSIVRPQEDHPISSGPNMHDKRFEEAVASTWSGRRICITERGYLGLVPRYAQVGDVIIFVKEGPTPFVLRRRKRGKCPLPEESGKLEDNNTNNNPRGYELIGEGYVHGADNPNGIRVDDKEWEKFEIS